jgi:RHS repeat-associated protein
MTADKYPYKPKPTDKFSFGLWTVGNRARDPFGDFVRPAISPIEIVRMPAEVGAWGVNPHDNDLAPIDATLSERDRIVRDFKKCRKENSRGHVLTDRRNTNSITNNTTYTYNYAGGTTSITYPSGRTITYTFNAAAQTTSATDVANSITYASNAHYGPAGALSSLQNNGSTIISTMYYNNRLQPCRISVKSSGTAPSSCSDSTDVGNILDYTYGFNYGTANNGNVASVANNNNTARSQSYTYDELNRVCTAKTVATSGTYAWGLSFGYDAWANLLSASVTQGSAYSLSVSATGKNQLSGLSYDAAGNMLNDGMNTYTYNAENQIATAAGVTYTYDGDGDRVQKSSGMLYWYGDGSDALDETSASGTLTDEYIFFGGARIARRDSSSNVDYYFADHLGSAHVVTNASGTIQDDSDFYPYGGERSYTSSSGNTHKFTGKERDTESGLDNFTARFYASTTGRFMSADDAKYVTAADPQTWNLYTYVANNPVNAVDPTGHAPNGDCLSCKMQADDENFGPADDDLIKGEADHDSDINYTRDCIQTSDDCKDEESGTNSGSGDQTDTNAGGETQNTSSSQPTASSTSDKRTDVMLTPDSVPPQPEKVEGMQYEMEYSIVPQADTMQQLQDDVSNLKNDPATQANYSKMEVRLWESQRGGAWGWQGETLNGHGHDVLNLAAGSADQRWYIDGKRVQLVIGKDSNGALIKAWTVHVEVTGKGPVFTKVD